MNFLVPPRMRRARVVLLAGVLVLSAVPARPQTAARATPHFLVSVWSSENGLPQNSVNCLAQTPDGYLWAGTRSGGLARFDGMRFVTFNPQTTPELKDVEFETLSVDARGTLWITAGNESVAALTEGKFRLVRERNALPRWHPLQVVAEDAAAVYLAAYENAVFRIPRHGAVNEMQRLALEPPPPGPPGSFFQSPDGAIWYANTAGSIGRLEVPPAGEFKTSVRPVSGTLGPLVKSSRGEIWAAVDGRMMTVTGDRLLDRTPTNGPPPKTVQRLVAGRDDSIWVWEGDRLRLLAAGEWRLSAPDFRPANGLDQLKFFADSAGGLWVINYGIGLWHVEPDGATTLLTKADGLPGVFITCWLEDSEGNVWIGTKEGGLARIRRSWFNQFTVAEGIPDEVAQSVCEDRQGTMWVGTANGGLAQKVAGRFLPVPLPALAGPPIESVTVFPDLKNGIWIGTVKGSVFRCVEGTVSRPFPAAQLRGRTADVVMQDSTGRVWFGNGSGAYYFQDNRLTTFGRTRGFVEDLGVRALAEGPPGTIWFGTEPGDVWQYADGRLTRHHPPAEWPNARVSALLPDADGSVWVGTLGGGLLRFEADRFTRITTEQGLPDNSITQLLEDADGNLWGGTYAGIFRAAQADLKRVAAGTAREIACSVHGHFDGLPAQAYSGWYQPSCWRTSDGQLWFTTVKGLVSVDPRRVAINRRPPPVVIEELRVDGVLHAFAAADGSATRPAASGVLAIPPGRHYVEFRFTGLNFTAPDEVRFKWQLQGAETQWHESLAQRAVGYGPLLPGDYCFRVLAANSDGLWNEVGASVAFAVWPYFWETWWFKAGLIASACLGIALAVLLTLRRRHRAEMERLERRHEMERERTRIAQDLHDDLGTSLTQISLLSSLLERENTPPAEISSLTQQIRFTSRAMVTALNEIVWAVNPKNDSLNEVAGYLGNFAEAFFRPGSIRCRLDIPSDLPERPVAAELRHGLFLAFKEAINNVAKHSRATEARVRIRCEGGELRITVEDNGAGFDLAAQRPGNGLANMANRLKKMGGRCEILTASGSATTVLFRLHLKIP